MFYFTLIVSLLYLAWMNGLVYYRANLTLALMSSGAMLFIGLAFPVLFLQAVGLLVLLVLWQAFLNNRLAIFIVSSILVVCAVYGYVSWQTLTLQQDLIERYPMQSMAERIPAPKVRTPIDSAVETNEWSKFEFNLATEIEMDQAKWASRSVSLRKLHEETTETFVNSSDFGFARMPNVVLRSGGYDSQIEPIEPVPQPMASEPIIFATEDLKRPYGGKRHDALRSMHFGALADFVNIQGFGYVKDRNHVAGFRPHQFSKMPSAGSLRIHRLELVSLLMHDKPVVYVSSELPRMGDLKHTTTRTLSEFEAKGLPALEKGEDLFVRETPTSLHLLGAVRSVAQCVKCHGGERGDLLGAFSYQFQRKE